ncbi:hypothetical protein [Isoptericola sp. G70]|uniref:hypothetical protein n=1 Tax=Isoptericola sp. G70 TaxID=3376633 RepID=UPI003A7FD6BB
MDTARSVLVLDDSSDLAEMLESATWLNRRRIDDVQVRLRALTSSPRAGPDCAPSCGGSAP